MFIYEPQFIADQRGRPYAGVSLPAAPSPSPAGGAPRRGRRSIQGRRRVRRAPGVGRSAAGAPHLEGDEEQGEGHGRDDDRGLAGGAAGCGSGGGEEHIGPYPIMKRPPFPAIRSGSVVPARMETADPIGRP